MQLGNITIGGNAVQTANTAFQIAKGSSAQRPAANAGMLRFNTDLGRFEAVTGATPAWANVGLGDGSVTSITLATNSTGLSITSPTVTTAGTINITLAGELAALNALSTTGLIARTGAATYTPRTIAASTAAGAQGVSITNGDGVAGAPVVGLSFAGLTAASSVANTAQIVVYDGTNNLRATIAQVSAALTGVTRTVRGSFTSANITNGMYAFTHGLGQTFNNITVWDNNNNVISPDNINATSNTVVTVDLTSYGTITGTYQIVVGG